MDDQDFKILYIIDTIPNSPAGHQLSTQAKQNVWTISIKNLSQIMVNFMKPIAIKLLVENPTSQLLYENKLLLDNIS